MKHPYVLSVYNFHNSITLEGQKCFIVMEYSDFGDLLKFSNKMKIKGQFYKESTLRKWLRQMIEGLIYIHLNNGTHRDIKPNNLLVFGDSDEDHDQMWLKIADFGCGKIFQDSIVRA